MMTFNNQQPDDHKKKAPGNPCSGSETDSKTRFRFISNKGRPLVSAEKLRGLPVHNNEEETLGVLKDLVIETDRGTVSYAVLLFDEDKSFALPFSALEIDPEAMTIYVDLQREVFEEGRGMASPAPRHSN